MFIIIKYVIINIMTYINYYVISLYYSTHINIKIMYLFRIVYNSKDIHKTYVIAYMIGLD